MKDPKKAKWIAGTSGVVLSALLLTQLTDANQDNQNEVAFSTEQIKQMSEIEKELTQLDWTNFEVQTVERVPVKSDRKTRRT